MPNFLQTTPFMHVPVTEFEAAVAFFRELLGFSPFVHRPDYAYLEREVAASASGVAKMRQKLPHGPAAEGYGQRELPILAPDGDLVCFGHAIPKGGS